MLARMDWIFQVDWDVALVPKTPLLEIVVRGTLTYLSLFVLLRVVLKRKSGAMGITDLLVVVLLADAAQNAMADDYRSVPDGILLTAVIICWAWSLDHLAFRYPRLRRLLYPDSLQLVRQGRILWKNMRRESISEDELRSKMRLQGIESLAEVKATFMESDGQLSFLTGEPRQAKLSDR
jgi:uncharacterized membrane protein YcaP (DUF421 family)